MAGGPGLWLARRAAAARLRAAAGLGQARTWLPRLALARFAVTGEPAPAILFAPQDLRTTDPVRADEFSRGEFTFAGRFVEAGNPFAVTPPTPEWADLLAGFAWLRHLRAAGTSEAATTARRLVDAWLAGQDRSPSAGRHPAIVAERLRAWLAASGLLLGEADRAFYRRFSRSLWSQARRLEAHLAGLPPGVQRLDALTALVTAGLCLEGEGALLRRASRQLGAELDRQILADGGHVSRNPAVLVGLVLDLLPLRQLFFARNETPPAAILTAVDRIMPMIRFFQLGDGTLARFNGMGPTAIDQVATALVYDGSRGQPAVSARQSRYERLVAGPAVLIADCGRPPPPDHGFEAHAGCLAFELSVGRQVLVMNCGAPPVGRPDWRQPVRRTAAHSTLTVAEASSSAFLRVAGRGTTLVTGPRAVAVERGDLMLSARHDGYRERNGIIHARRLELAPDGTALAGEDRIEGAAQPWTLRFHLHPAVQPVATEQGLSVLLRWGTGEMWAFSADLPVAIEDSVAVAVPEGPRRTFQLVIAGAAGARAVSWSFRRLNRPEAPRDAEPAPTLPF